MSTIVIAYTCKTVTLIWGSKFKNTRGDSNGHVILTPLRVTEDGFLPFLCIT